MYEYRRRVHYHETDKMGITHHANYIKWMEEARIAFLDTIGYGYARLEQDGLISPVVEVKCRYKRPTTFDDTVLVQVWVEEFKGVRLTIGYRMTNAATGEVVLTGRTLHCFTNAEGRPVMLRRQFPQFAEVLTALAEEYAVVAAE